MNPKSHSPNIFRRRGTMASELLVAAVLLMAATAFLSSLIHRIHGVLQTSRQYQLGTQFLTNQLEWITSTEQVSSDETLKLPSHLLEYLPDASLDSNLIEDADGRRIVLQLNWRTPALHRIEMVGWLDIRNSIPIESRNRNQLPETTTGVVEVKP